MNVPLGFTRRKSGEIKHSFNEEGWRLKIPVWVSKCTTYCMKEEKTLLGWKLHVILFKFVRKENVKQYKFKVVYGLQLLGKQKDIGITEKLGNNGEIIPSVECIL